MLCGACGGFYNQACPRWPSCFPAEQPETAAVTQLRAEHDRRVTELLEANNREVERRRRAERRVAFLEDVLLEVPTDGSGIGDWWDTHGGVVGEIMDLGGTKGRAGA